MKIKELRKIAFKKYKSHRLNSWILATICALFIAAITLISIVSEALVIIFIPFVILPFFFACKTFKQNLNCSSTNTIKPKPLKS